MNKDLKLNQEISLENKAYTVVGIDHYHLKNVLETVMTWKSYTLKDAEGNKTWITYGIIPDYFIQWYILDKEEFKQQAATKSPNLELSGIAHITFEGNAGYSSPNAELLCFPSAGTSYDFVAMERFLNQNGEIVEPTEAYYQSGKILKDFTI
jgi:hypothetical protein